MLALEATSKVTQEKKPRPRESIAGDGSLPASEVCRVPGPPRIVWLLGASAGGTMASGLLSFCRNGGSWSPQWRPLSRDQAIEHWLKPTRLSLEPASRLGGWAGLWTMSFSAWRRKVQSWLTRTLPLGLRLRQPRVPAPMPMSRLPVSAVTAPAAGNSRAAARPPPPPLLSTSSAALSRPLERNADRLLPTCLPSFITGIWGVFSFPLTAFCRVLASAPLAGPLVLAAQPSEPAAWLSASYVQSPTQPPRPIEQTT